ncbi:MAG: vitamin K epoxide reductase family protein [Xenococcaceae cyanobacterium]
MRRRRSLPWIYRWSRPLIGAIALLGAFLTAYMTAVKFTGGEVVCLADAAQSGAGCNDVLSSPYASPFGVPLTVFGFLAYTTMATFALGPLFVNRDTNKGLRSKLEDWTWRLLLAGGTAMAVFSSYLMYVLAFELKTACLYCIGSALFCLSLLMLTIFGRDWEDIGQIFFTGIIVAMVTLVGTMGVYANVNSPESTVITMPNTPPQAPIGWEITTTSGEAEIALAKHLKQIGAKKYGAYTCPHCYTQKQLFGKEAFSEIDYIECNPDGKNAQPQVCIDAGIRAFPTWEINGEFYQGTQSLENLAKLSGYQGSMNFKYTMQGF